MATLGILGLTLLVLAVACLLLMVWWLAVAVCLLPVIVAVTVIAERRMAGSMSSGTRDPKEVA